MSGAERCKVNWGVDEKDVIITVEIRVDGHWFMDIARNIYHTLSPSRRPADRLLEGLDESSKSKTG